MVAQVLGGFGVLNSKEKLVHTFGRLVLAFVVEHWHRWNCIGRIEVLVHLSLFQELLFAFRKNHGA